jgi:hypothetical protein
MRLSFTEFREFFIFAAEVAALVTSSGQEMNENVCLSLNSSRLCLRGRLQKWLFLLNDKALSARTLAFLFNDRRLHVLLMIREDHTFD